MTGGGVVIGAVRTGVSTEVDLGFEFDAIELMGGVGRGVGVGDGVVLGGLLAANSVRGWVRGGLLTGGFLTVMDEATLWPATASGCVAG
jgi:hypothetical protein